MPKNFVDNELCSCRDNDTCASCRFCAAHDTTDGRKALCEKITRFLVFTPFYQAAIADAVQMLFPDRIVYEDEKDICAMLFEAVLFEDNRAGTTPFSYFVQNAPLSAEEQRLYEAWRTRTRYEFFVVEDVLTSEELHLADLGGENRYRVYEHRGTTSIKKGSVVIARIVPFLKGWMITTESVVSFSGSEARERLQTSYGIAIRQLSFARKYHEETKRRMVG
jgi:hypothetical protein